MKFRFSHTSPQEILDDPSIQCRPGSTCEIVTDDGTVLASGDALLHPKDNFSRPIGRKVAAGNAIRTLIPRWGRRDKRGQEERRELWLQLFCQSPSTFKAGRI